MPEDQKDIYYATGETISFIEGLPQAERLHEKGYEILYFTHEVDEFVIQTLRDYEGKQFKSVNRDDLGLESEEEKKETEKKEKSLAPLLEFVKETLGDGIKEVKLSHKLQNHPVCLSAAGAISFEMEKYLNSVQPGSGASAERVLELNAGHSIIERLGALIDSDRDRAAAYAKILYEQARMMAGLPTEQPASYSELIFSLM